MSTEDRDSLIKDGKSSLATYTTARENGMLIEVQVPHWRDALIKPRSGEYHLLCSHDGGDQCVSEWSKSGPPMVFRVTGALGAARQGERFAARFARPRPTRRFGKTMIVMR
jgi:hypothetical protein